MVNIFNKEVKTNIAFNLKHIKFFLILFLTYTIISIFIDLKPIIFLIFLSVFNVFLMMYERFIDLPIDIEFSTFSSVIMTLKFGLFWGILAATTTKMAVVIFNKDFNKNTLFSITSYILAAVLTNLLKNIPNLSIIILGLIIPLFTNLYIFCVSKFVLFLSNYEIFMYSLTNLIFNIIIFIIYSNVLSIIPIR